MEDRDERLWAAFAIEMDEHPKIATLSDEAFRAYFEGTFYSRRMLTDGFLDARIVKKRWGLEAAEELASNDPDKPSWIPVEGGWRIHDFEKHHPLKAEIEASRAELRAKRSAAGRAGGKASGEARRSKSKQNGSKAEANVKQNEAKSQSQSKRQDLSMVTESVSPVVHVRELSTDPETNSVLMKRATQAGFKSAADVWELIAFIDVKLDRFMQPADVINLVDSVVKKSPVLVRNKLAYVRGSISKSPFEVQQLIDQGIPWEAPRLEAV